MQTFNFRFLIFNSLFSLRLKKYILIIFFFSTQLLCFAQLNTDRIMSIGRNALYFEDYVLSIQYFNQIIQVKPYLAEPYMYRAIAKIQLGDYQGADNDCTEAISLNPFIPQAFYARGFARLRLGYYSEASEDFSKALEFSPANEAFLMNRIRAREMNEDYSGALNDLETYMQSNKSKPELFFEKGRILLSMKDTVGAETNFGRYLELDSTSSIGWSARALLRMQKDDLDGALSDYNKAIARKTEFAGDYINRGIINVRKFNYMQALSDYDNAIRLDKSNMLAYYNRALLRNNLGDKNNALDDFTTVLEMDSTQTEALLQKALLEQSLGNYRQAIADYKQVLEKYPYFTPAYNALADIETTLGNPKQAYRYRKQAFDIESNKKEEEREQKEDLAANNKMSTRSQETSARKRSEFFNRFAAQNLEDVESDERYTGTIRGNVQNRYVDVMNERNFVLTYYSKPDELRRTPLYQIEVDNYNKAKKLAADLKLTNSELPLTQELIDAHFSSIDALSKKLNENPTADLYFNRAIEFALVQDFTSSVDDLNKAIALRPSFVLAYFMRANIRYKSIEIRNYNVFEPTSENDKNNQTSGAKNTKLAAEAQYKYDVELIMRDYDKVNELSVYPFPFASFNKANILCTIQDFRSAISNYSRAIQAEPDFAEAYFNRGLTYLYIGEDEKGLADLSKAGELGIVNVYNLILRFKK